MIIGTVRPEEARIFDKYAGFHKFHAEETQEEYGSFEIFFVDGKGWTWQSCFHGCLPDSDAENGYFATSEQALEDADEWNPLFDDDYE